MFAVLGSGEVQPWGKKEAVDELAEVLDHEKGLDNLGYTGLENKRVSVVKNEERRRPSRRKSSSLYPDF